MISFFSEPTLSQNLWIEWKKFPTSEQEIKYKDLHFCRKKYVLIYFTILFVQDRWSCGMAYERGQGQSGKYSAVADATDLVAINVPQPPNNFIPAKKKVETA